MRSSARWVPPAVVGVLDPSGSDQKCLVRTELLHGQGPDIIAEGVGVPHRLTQQVLHPCRVVVPGVLGQ